MLNRTMSLTAAMAIFSGAAGAAAQCDSWVRSGSESRPFAGSAYAAASWTPPGATVPSLYVAGSTTSAQGIAYAHIVRWTGSAWQGVGSGTNNEIFALLGADLDGPAGLFPSLLYAAGRFTSAGGHPVSGVASWDGSAWSSLNFAAPGEGYALAAWDPDGSGPQGAQLVLGGYFPEASNIARWNGTNWSGLGGGMEGFGSAGTYVYALTVWDSDGAGPFPGQLVAGGHFLTAGPANANYIAMWTGTEWVPIGGGMAGRDPDFTYVRALTTWDPDGPGPLNPVLVAGGKFTSAGGVAANGVAYWDGVSWHAMNTGTGPNDFDTFVGSLTTWDPDGPGPQIAKVVAAPTIFSHGALVDSPAAWNGTDWQPLGINLGFTTGLTTYDPDGAGPQTDQLVATTIDDFSVPQGRIDGLAVLTPTGWAPEGLRPSVLAFTTMGGRVVVGGSFDFLAGTDGNAHNIAMWNGADTTALGTGASSFVRALKVYRTSGPLARDILVAGGDFTSVGNVNANRIAQYDEQDIVNPWSALGPGFDNRVFAVERFNSQTYAAGQFTLSGGTTVNQIARWNAATAAWEPLGLGLNGVANALKAYNGALYVGGSFSTAGGVQTGGLARWNGSSWSAVAGTFSGFVMTMEVYNNELVLGGQFPGVSGSPNIARFNGTTVLPVGAGGADQFVTSLAVGADNKLYVGGAYTTIGGIAAAHIARWTGAAWEPVRGGADSQVAALTPFRNEIEAGGAFFAASGGSLVSPGWARYSEDGQTWIVHQPQDITAPCSGSGLIIPIKVVVASGYPVTYRWRKNGTPIFDGPTPTGASYQGTATEKLLIVSPMVGDNGSYDCVISSCTPITSDPAILTVCYANCDCSSLPPVLNVNDFICYQTRFAAGDSYANCDGSTIPPVLNVNDFICFLNAFSAGCP